MKALSLYRFAQCIIWPLIKETEVKGGAARVPVGGLGMVLSVVL